MNKQLRIAWLIPICLACLISIPTHAQFTFTPEGRLALSAKIWGFIKFHHTEVKAKRVNWDSVLLAHINQIENAGTPELFNNEIAAMIQSAGTMRMNPDTAIPETGLNVDFEWIKDVLLSPANVNSLFNIADNFNPDTNSWVFVDPNFGANYIRMTNESNANLTQPLPIKTYRRLLLFRLWNVVNYYFPYKHDMTVTWDKSLMDLIHAFDTCTTPLSYHLAWATFATRLNDSHAAYVRSNLLYQNWKFNISMTPPIYLKRIENKTVIARMFGDVPGLAVGDIIHKINGMDIDSLRIEFRKYFSASNDAAGDRNALIDMLSTYGFPDATFTAEDANGNITNVYTDVVIPYSNMANAVYNCDWCGPTYEITECGYGYVHMGKLFQNDVVPMYEQLKNTPAIIFDIRNYPNGTLYAIAQAMFAASTPFVKFHSPIGIFPGDYFTEVYENYGTNGNPNAYKGQVYVLVNEITQSHAEFTTMLLQSMSNSKVITIGSTTAGADGNITSFALPGGITLTFTGLGVYYPDGGKTQRVGVRIDTFVTPTIKGIREGRDEVMEAALDCLTKTNEPVGQEEFISIYPNPSQGRITIDYIEKSNKENYQISIYDVGGKKIEELMINSLPADLNLQHLTAGVYELKMNSANRSFNSKLVITPRN